jgi:RES domain-containing protein
MPVWAAGTPAIPLVRVGRLPNPLALPPREYRGSGRYDDPGGEYGVFYLAESITTCYVELLANQRPSLTALAAIHALPQGEPGDLEPNFGQIPRDWLRDWCRARALGRAELGANQRWLDTYAAETRRELRGVLANRLLDLGLDDFDFGDALSRNRLLSQAVSRWAYEQEFRGIVFPSRFEYGMRCWAVFETADFQALDVVPLNPDAVELRTALTFHGLTLV